MSNRLELHEILVTLLGSRNVYFQPPSSTKMDYPCIIYRRNRVNEVFASDKLYKERKAYTVIVIDSNPDSLIPDRIRTLPLCSFDRHYTANNLNHDVYNVYY